jgi:hypothetical protein
MDLSSALNLAALVASLAALAISSVLALRQVQLSRNANQLPVAVDFLWRMRPPEFLRQEEVLWQELPQQDQDLPFSGLPQPLRNQAQEVATFYQTVSYIVALGVVDERLAILPLQYRAPKTWAAVRPFVVNERVRRNDPRSFLNAFEDFVHLIRATDVASLSEQLSRNLRRAA